MDKDAIEIEVKGIVSSITGVAESKIEGDLNFIDDMGIESVMAVSIASKIEETYDFDIPVHKLGEFDSLNSIVDIIFEFKQSLLDQ